MPQQRQRIVFCDCLDCVQQPATTDIASSSSPANEAAAKQEPPPKCLMFVLSGVLVPHPKAQTPSATDTVLDMCNMPHLNRATAQGNLCLLTVRQSSPTDCCSELAQLLNIYEDYEKHTPPISLANRFKGMQASFSSNSSSAHTLAAWCGMSSSSVLDPDADGAEGAAADDNEAGVLLPAALTGGAARSKRAAGGNAAAQAAAAATAAAQLPDPAEAARRILLELGLQQADAGLDMLMVHLDSSSILPQQQQQQQHGQQQGAHIPAAGSTLPNAAAASAAVVLTWLDRTLRYLNNSSAFKDTVLLAVLATPGAAGQLPGPVPLLQAAGGVPLKPSDVGNLPAAADAGNSSKPRPGSADGAAEQQQQPEVVVKQQQQQPEVVVKQQQQHLQQAGRQVCRPPQSWEQLAGNKLNIDAQRPILCMRRLPGVIRRDGCARFSLSECCSSSGVLGLVVDRLIPEIAYKLGRAPKYGA